MVKVDDISARTRDWLTLMRPMNSFIGALTVPLGALLAYSTQFEGHTTVSVALATLAVALFMGGGNTLNDISDVAIDKAAHPFRPLPSGRISPLAAKKVMYFLFIFSLLVTLIASYSLWEGGVVGWWHQCLTWSLAFMLMVAYETGPTLKAKGVVGNVAISVMVGMVIIHGAASVGLMATPLVFLIAGIAAVGNLSRELVKDVQDLDSDEGRVSLPMQIGAVKTRVIAWLLLLATLILLAVPYASGLLPKSHIGFQTPAILILLMAKPSLFKEEDEKAQKIIRIGMLFGLLGFLVSVFFLE